ncbi:MAG: prepilin-type N-terminal cleavage/methylation domain-containing protein [Deltaproteobacteria bacterium]
MTRNRNQEGFTLIEVMIAVTVFAIGILAVAAMTMRAVNGNTSAAISTDSTRWVSSQIDTIMGMDFNDPQLAAGNHGPIPAGNAGQYQVGWTVANGTVPNTRIVTVTITRNDVGGGQIQTTYTYLKAQNVRTWE